jgi:hypothetical protein
MVAHTKTDVLLVIALEKGIEKYVWLFHKETAHLAAANVFTQALNPELSLTLGNAHQLTDKIADVARDE